MAIPRTLIEQKDLPNHEIHPSPKQKKLGKYSQIGKTLSFVFFINYILKIRRLS